MYEDEGGKLADIKTFNVNIPKKQAVRVISAEDFSLKKDDKIMLWDNFSSFVPKCTVYEIK